MQEGAVRSAEKPRLMTSFFRRVPAAPTLIVAIEGNAEA